MLRFSINNLLDLRLENNKTNIYVNNKLFIHCKYLLLNIPLDKIEDLENSSSVDEVVDKLGGPLPFSYNTEFNISPKVQFLGHCSNLQAWYENKYNSCLIHSNLAFPLLKKLAEAGDLLAKKVFKEEIAKKFKRGGVVTIQFLLYNGYLDYLNNIELEYVFEHLRYEFITEIIGQLKKLLSSPLGNYRTIRSLIDLILFIDLKYNRDFLILLFQNIPNEIRYQFTRSVLLLLNYKEFDEYKIPYGKFFYYFEGLITFLSENYPNIKELLKILDSGFYHSTLSLEEKLAYGSLSYQYISSIF